MTLFQAKHIQYLHGQEGSTIHAEALPGTAHPGIALDVLHFEKHGAFRPGHSRSGFDPTVLEANWSMPSLSSC